MTIQRIKPGPGQESVWDYPRPPRLEATDSLIIVEFDQRVIVETQSAYRVLETSHPPTYYLPPQDVDATVLIPSSLQTFCEFKGEAHYWTLQSGDRHSENAAWYYPLPTQPFASIRDYVAFYPGRVDSCYVDGEQVTVQAGDFYGGWITSRIVGPFKGGAGTAGW